MKKDYLISILVFFITGILIFVITRDFFLSFAAETPLLAGFIKFFVLATVGDFIGLRIKNNKWGTFYSFGGSWRIDQENFMKNVSFVNNLKIREIKPNQKVKLSSLSN